MNYTVKDLIPQREPFIFVDKLLYADNDSCITDYVIPTEGNLVYNGRLMESGIIEHMTQSAACLARYQALCKGASTLPLGMIVEIKNFILYEFPETGRRLETTVYYGMSLGIASVVSVKTMVDNICIAESEFKISID